MCKKLPYCNPRIDSCLKDEINRINESMKQLGKPLRTISSCCGHNKYPPTIVIRDTEINKVIETFSNMRLKNYDPRKKKQSNRYYKRDQNGYYFIPFIPEVSLGEMSLVGVK